MRVRSPSPPLGRRILAALWMLLVVRRPRTVSPERDRLDEAVGHLFVGRWCSAQASLTPRHADLLNEAVRQEFAAATRLSKELPTIEWDALPQLTCGCVS